MPKLIDAAGEPDWLTYARTQIGFHEAPANHGIQKFINLAHAGHEGDAWCAIFSNACLEQAGVKGTRSASSQSFRSSKDFVKLKGPALGAIAVYWRGNPKSSIGHVGFYLGETASSVLTLGGNQGDMVKQGYEPKARLRGYWWPKGVPLPKVGAIKATNAGAATVTKET